MKSRSSSPQTSPQVVRRYRVEGKEGAGTTGTFLNKMFQCGSGAFAPLLHRHSEHAHTTPT